MASSKSNDRIVSEGLRAMDKILSSLMTKAESAPFREPVKWRDMGLNDYPHVVKRPMDLGTIKLMLEKGDYYRMPLEVYEDVRLVWANCRAYNPEGSELATMAASCSKRFEEKYCKVAATLRDSPSLNRIKEERPVTAEERRWFAHHIYRVRMEERTSVIHRIDHRCPDALAKVDDDIEIDIDKLDPRTFREVCQIIREALPRPPPEGRRKRGVRTEEGGGAGRKAAEGGSAKKARKSNGGASSGSNGGGGGKSSGGGGGASSSKSSGGGGASSSKSSGGGGASSSKSSGGGGGSSSSKGGGGASSSAGRK